MRMLKRALVPITAAAITASLGLGLAVVPSVIGGSLGLTSVDVAQAEDKEERRKPPTKKRKPINPKLAKKLQEAYEAIGEEKYDEAMSLMRAYVERPDKQKPHEQAKVWQIVAYVYASKEDYRNAVQAYEKAMATGGLEDIERLDMMYNLGQLYMTLEDYDGAIRQLTAWFKEAENPNARAYILLANAYYQKEDIPTATKLTETAIKKSKGEGKEQWYRFLLSLYYQQEFYKKAEGLLRFMVKKFPGSSLYWTQLSAVTMENKKEKQSFLIAELAYLQGMLTKGREYERLAQFYSYYDVPYKAAKIMKEGYDKKLIEPDAKNLEQYGLNWIASREHKKAIAPLTQAAKLSPKGDLYLRLAQTYVAEEDWAKAKENLNLALGKKELNRRGNALLLLGMAKVNLKEYEGARAAFKKAVTFEESEKNAAKWLTYLNSLMEAEDAKQAQEEEDRKKKEEAAAKKDAA